jgi:hypothetical protein
LRNVLEARQRAGSGATFAASGLHLTGVDYAPRFELPPTHAPVLFGSGAPSGRW